MQVAVGALGNGLVQHLTPSQQADCQVLQALPEPPGAVVADKAYGTDRVLKAIAQQDAEPVIPPKALRTEQRPYDQNLYVDRNKIERFFGRLKEARGLATRYEKTACLSRLSPPARCSRLDALTVHRL